MVREIETSAIFGESFMVEILWTTDYDGRVIDPEKEEFPRTFHGTFPTEGDAMRWMNAFPEYDDIYDMEAQVVNNVRPSPLLSVPPVERLRVRRLQRTAQRRGRRAVRVSMAKALQDRGDSIKTISMKMQLDESTVRALLRVKDE